MRVLLILRRIPYTNTYVGCLVKPEAQRVFHLYHVGTSAKWGGATVFWQIDANEQVRSGKIILYNSETGHRVKEPHSYVNLGAS